MSGALDMTLDDLIKNSKKSGGGRGGGGGRGRGRGRGAGPGPSRRFPNNRGVNRSVPYAAATAAAKAPESTWQHDLFPGQAGAYPPNAARTFSIETGTKLYVSNLDYGVSIEDIKELFSEVGDLKRYTIHYDRSGRSKGTAEVVFSRRLDAVEAVKRYNNVQLDGKPMKIEIVGTNIGAPPPVPVPTIMKGTFGNPNGFSRSGQGRGAAPRPKRGGHANGGRGRGGKVSAEDLDADLDKYHAEAMQIN